MEAWLSVGKDAILSLRACETLLKIYAAASGNQTLIDTLVAGPDSLPARLVDLVDDSGIDVAAAWKLLAEETGQTDLIKFAPLLNRLNNQAAPQTVTWPILNEDLNRGSKTSGISFGLNSHIKASLEFESGAKAPTASSATKVPLLADEKLVRIAASGAIVGSANAKVPLNIGSIGATASSDGCVKLSYYTHHLEDTVFASSVLDSLSQLRSPFSLSSTASFFTAFPKGVMQLETAADLRLTFNLALTAPFNMGVPSTASLSVGAKARVSGAYQVTITKPGTSTPQVRLTLERVASTAKEFAASLKTDLDVSTLAAHVKQVLTRAKDVNTEVSDLIARLDPYFTPGTLLKSRIETMVARLIKEERVNDLVLKALGFSGAGLPGDMLAKLIEDKINALDGLWDTEQNLAVKSLVDRIANATQVPEMGVALGEHLAPRLHELLDGLQNDLHSRLWMLVADIQVFKELQSALNDIGTPVKGVCDTINERTQALLGPIRTMLNKYQATVSNLLDQIASYVDDTVRMRIDVLESQTATRTLDIDVIFDATSAQAGALYSRMFTDDLTSVFDAITKAPPGVVQIQKTALSACVQELSRSGVTLNFGKLAFAFNKILTVGVKFKIDESGTIDAIIEETVDSQASFFNTRERVVFVSSQKLQTGHAQATTLALSVNRCAKAVSSGDVAAFFKPLVGAQILPNSVPQNAILQWAAWRSKANAEAIACQLSLARNLSDSEILSLLQLTRDDDGIARAKVPFEVSTIQQAAAQALHVSMFGNQGGLDEAPVQNGVGKIYGTGALLLFDILRKRQASSAASGIPAGLVWLANLRGTLEGAIKQYAIHLPDTAERQLERTKVAARMVADLAEAFEAMRYIVIAKPVMSAPAQPGEMTAETATRLGKGIVEKLSRWVMTDGPSFENLIGLSDSSDIDAATIGLFRAMQILVGPGQLTATMELLDRETLKPLEPKMIASLN